MLSILALCFWCIELNEPRHIRSHAVIFMKRFKKDIFTTSCCTWKSSHLYQNMSENHKRCKTIHMVIHARLIEHVLWILTIFSLNIDRLMIRNINWFFELSKSKSILSLFFCMKSIDLIYIYISDRASCNLIL